MAKRIYPSNVFICSVYSESELEHIIRYQLDVGAFDCSVSWYYFLNDCDFYPKNKVKN